MAIGFDGRAGYAYVSEIAASALEKSLRIDRSIVSMEPNGTLTHIPAPSCPGFQGRHPLIGLVDGVGIHVVEMCKDKLLVSVVR